MQNDTPPNSGILCVKGDLHDWRIWSQSQGETNFVCAKCFWRMSRRQGTYGMVFDDVIKPPLKLNLN